MHARRGNLYKVTSLEVDPEKIKAFHVYCAEHGITILEDEELSWLLCTIKG